MSSELVAFVFDGHEVRTVTISGEPWFNVGDLCAILEIQNPRDVVAKNLRKDDVAKIYVTIADGRQRQVWFTNEPGVYRLILRSNKPDADSFQDWICREVLPQIRRTGQFSLGIPMLAIQPIKWRKEFPQEFCLQFHHRQCMSLAAVRGALQTELLRRKKPRSPTISASE
jgi:prophage antirepressor-like protein